MSVSAIIQANGADLLDRLVAPQGQAPAATASVEVLKKALAVAQLSASEIIGGGSGESSSISLFV